MRALELFSGTGSVGVTLQTLGYEVTSVDITDRFHPPTHKTDILTWDYKMYPAGHFDVIWASPPCETFSKCRLCWIGRKNRHFGDAVITKSMIVADEISRGLPLLRRTEEIIAYFHPRRWVIENPAGGRMKNYIEEPPRVVDYCKYADWGYNKPTAIWSNSTTFVPLRCHKDCDSMMDVSGRRFHRVHLGGPPCVESNGVVIPLNNAALRAEYRTATRVTLQCIQTTLRDRYRVPEGLVRALVE